MFDVEAYSNAQAVPLAVCNIASQNYVTYPYLSYNNPWDITQTGVLPDMCYDLNEVKSMTTRKSINIRKDLFNHL